MEHENKNQTETALIDIFYKDTERLNSIISQRNKGTLQSLTTKSEDLQGSTFYSGGKVGIPGSGLECNQQSKEENKKIIEENRLIQDFSVIDLLQTLDLEVIDSVTNDIPSVTEKDERGYITSITPLESQSSGSIAYIVFTYKNTLASASF